MKDRKLLIDDSQFRKILEDKDFFFIIKDINKIFKEENIIYKNDFLDIYERLKNDFLKSDDQDIKNLGILFLEKLIYIEDLKNNNKIKFGSREDKYKLFKDKYDEDEIEYSTNQYSLLAIAYENRYDILSPKYSEEFHCIKIKKNALKKYQSRYRLSNIYHYYIYMAIYTEDYIGKYLEYLNFTIHTNFKVDKWDKLQENNKRKILDQILKDYQFLQSFNWDRLGKIGNNNSVISLKDKKFFYEYRISIPDGTYRIYFKKKSNKIEICLFYQKKIEKIDSKLNNLLEQYN